MDKMQATPQNPWWGVPARLVQGYREASETPFGLPNPPVRLINQFLGIPGLQKTLEAKSYGVPILGSTNKPLISDDLLDSAGFVPSGTVAKGAALLGASTLPFLRLLGKGAKGLPPALASNKQSGAITIGGNPDNYLTHAFNPVKAGDIAQSEKLISPSLGISNGIPNDYNPHSPQFIFRPGAFDVNTHSGALLNRDGYFANPKGLVEQPDGTYKYSPEEHIAEIMDADKAAAKTYGFQDWRLGQHEPGGSHTLAIGASPSFKSFAEFEASPLGQGALERYDPTKGSHQPLWDEAKAAVKSEDLTDNHLRAMIMANNKGHTPDQWEAPLTDIWRKSEQAPSAMAELKFRENLPLNPQDAFIHVPKLMENNPGALSQLMDLRDKGYRFVPESDLVGHDNPSKALARIATPEGTFDYPPSLAKPGTPMHDLISGLDPLEKHYSRLLANKGSPVSLSGKPFGPVPKVVPKFEDLKEAEDWMLDNGDEVLFMLDEGINGLSKAKLTPDDILSIHQSVAELAHSPGFMSQPNWHDQVANHAKIMAKQLIDSHD